MIVKPTEDQIRYVVDHMMEIEHESIEAVMWGGFDAEKLVKMLAAWPMLWCCINDRTGHPAVIGGLYFKLPAVAEAMMFGTQHFGEVVKEVEDASNRVLETVLEQYVRRVEVRSLAKHKVAHRWYRNLKLKFETAMPQYGANGETFFLFSRLREV